MNPWLIVGFLVTLIAVAGGSYMKGMDDGATEAISAWQAREVTELAAANAKILELESDAREAEQDAAMIVSDIGDKLEKEKRAHAKTEGARRLAVLAGNERVSVAVTGCESPGSSAGTETAATAGEPPAARAFLHPAVAADLEQLTGEADDTARELNACIAIAQADRRLINGASP